MAILRTIVWFFYFFGALIVLTPKMNEAKRRKAAGDESGCRAIVDRYVPMWMSTLMRIAGCTVTVNGLENIPKDRAVVFTPNHQSDYDIPITLVHLDRPHALVAKVETLKIPLEIMLRLYLLQNLYDLSDEATVAEAIDSRPFSDFCDIDSSNQVPDGDTLGRFWNLLIKNGLRGKLFAHVVAALMERG